MQCLGLWHRRAERLAQSPNGARVQLRDARLVHADLRTNLLHGGFGVVIQRDNLLLAFWQRGDRPAHA
jgi:2-polyprenyl-6-methoxyphenol hydroxylase-like FAD-dependent oxidoreductase